jgi:hypothetical protein
MRCFPSQIAAELLTLLRRRGDQDDRAVCNLLILACAADLDVTQKIAIARMIEGLGFTALSSVVATQCGAIRVEKIDQEYLIKTEYSPRFNAILRQNGVKSTFKSRKGWGRGKVRHIPCDARVELWVALCDVFPGETLLTDGKISFIPHQK